VGASPTAQYEIIMDKSKQYKTFAFPNRLTPLEQYYYYLYEFQVIPRKIPVNKIEEIFTHAAKDYLDNLLDLKSFCVIASHFMFDTDLDEYIPGLTRLMSYCSELDETHQEEIDAVKKLLTIFVTTPLEFNNLVRQGKMDAVFTE